MKLSQKEMLVLEYLKRQDEDVKVIPKTVKGITPETLQFTLAQLQAKGLVQYMEGGYSPTKKAQEVFKKKISIKDEIIAYGHPDITANHERNIMITKNSDPTGRDCIGVRANKGCKDIDSRLKQYLRFGKGVRITVSADGVEEEIDGFGSPALVLTDENSIVITKSDSIDGRTVAILADKGAFDLKKSLREKLKKQETRLKITIEV